MRPPFIDYSDRRVELLLFLGEQAVLKWWVIKILERPDNFLSYTYAKECHKSNCGPTGIEFDKSADRARMANNVTL